MCIRDRVEAVGENLVQNAAGEPLRRLEVRRIGRELPVLAAAGTGLAADVLFQHEMPAGGAQLEVVEAQPGVLRRKGARPPLVVVARCG